MAKFEVRVVGKRRESIDEKRLAEALLDLIENLSDTDRQKMDAVGEQALKQNADKQVKGNAA